jgi:rfaE bifunctional protein nucleotidyltransferase chain/domain
VRNSSDKIKSIKNLKKIVEQLQKKGKKVVFTNGCFDIVHAGHVSLFAKARSYGDALIAAVNSDSSVKRLKGPKRPLVDEKSRCKLLAALESVDYVVVFKEDTPAEIIKQLKPDILIKGGDYKIDEIVGRKDVKKVVRFPFIKGFSTTGLINKILDVYGK